MIHNLVPVAQLCVNPCDSIIVSLKGEQFITIVLPCEIHRENKEHYSPSCEKPSRTHKGGGIAQETTCCCEKDTCLHGGIVGIVCSHLRLEHSKPRGLLPQAQTIMGLGLRFTLLQKEVLSLRTQHVPAPLH